MRQPIDAYAHGILDYVTGASLLAVGRARGGAAGRTLRLAGAGALAYSLLTDYELGLLRRIPYPLHLALDAASAASLLVAGAVQRSPLVAGAGLLEAGAVAVSDPSGAGR